MSEENDSGGADKSHDPTPQKLLKSRQKGDVPYSTEVTAAATYVGFLVALLITMGWTAPQLHGLLKGLLHRPDTIAALLFDAQDSQFFAHFTTRIMVSILPVFLVVALGAVLSIIAQQAFAVSLSKIKPKMSRLSIVDNAKQKYGPNGLSEFVKSTSKLGAVLVILLFAYNGRFEELPSLAQLPPAAIAQLLLKESIVFCSYVTGAAIFIAAIDLPWRKFQHHNKLKMTLQEVKEENKETEGDPALKSARRSRAESIATNRMMQDVPTADIIIVNPTHYAVALKWDRKNNAAPKCVAKGVDEVAARIREAASAAGVPIRRDPPTARSIYSVVKVGHEIKKEHYSAVAAAIHYADEMRKKWKKPYSS
ncbi:MAG: flagellar biosynthetic protein FlhB [Hyphococcus sp.]|nr:MAG: flagellar biosynthetic protein FlhB [Marinicaulis sp.]